MDWHQSGDFVMMVILGGSGTLWGPLLGAVIYTLAANVLSSWYANLADHHRRPVCRLRAVLPARDPGAERVAPHGAAVPEDDEVVPHAAPAYEPIVAEGKHG